MHIYSHTVFNMYVVLHTHVVGTCSSFIITCASSHNFDWPPFYKHILCSTSSTFYIICSVGTCSSYITFCFFSQFRPTTLQHILLKTVWQNFMTKFAEAILEGLAHFLDHIVHYSSSLSTGGSGTVETVKSFEAKEKKIKKWFDPKEEEARERRKIYFEHIHVHTNTK